MKAANVTSKMLGTRQVISFHNWRENQSHTSQHVHVLSWQLYRSVAIDPGCRCEDARGAVLPKGENIRLPNFGMSDMLSSPHLRMVHRMERYIYSRDVSFKESLKMTISNVDSTKIQ